MEAEQSDPATTFASELFAWFVSVIPHIVAAAVILVVGLWLAGWAGRAVRRAIERNDDIDHTFAASIGSIVRYGITLIVLIAALTQIGFQTTSLLAALGAAGLAIGLALQSTLSNVAAGFMLLWLRPFRVGDYIEGGGVSGTVKQVGLFSSELETYDGLFEFVPNSALWNQRITNHSRLPTRMIDLSYGISYDDDIGLARRVLLHLIAGDARVLNEPSEPNVIVNSLDDSAVTLRLRLWVSNDDYWSMRRELTERGKVELEAAGVSIPYPQLDVHTDKGATTAAA